MMFSKKSLLLVLSLYVLASCSTNSDDIEPNILTTKAKVLKAELPESFTMGQTYNIEVFYELASACHMDLGLKVDRGITSSEYYIYGVAAYDADQIGCDQTSTDLQGSGTFEVVVENLEDYVFYIWEGFDQDGKDIYVPQVIQVSAASAQ